MKKRYPSLSELFLILWYRLDHDIEYDKTEDALDELMGVINSEATAPMIPTWLTPVRQQQLRDFLSSARAMDRMQEVAELHEWYRVRRDAGKVELRPVTESYPHLRDAIVSLLEGMDWSSYANYESNLEHPHVVALLDAVGGSFSEENAPKGFDPDALEDLETLAVQAWPVRQVFWTQVFESAGLSPPSLTGGYCD
jgi:hypothetical protein